MKGKNFRASVLMLLLVTACISDKENKIDFCERFKADQSNLVRKEMPESEKKANFEARKNVFKENWTILKSLIEEGKLSTVQEDSCINEFISATLIHVVQNYPASIFNKETINQLKIEADKGDIKLNHLITMLKFYKDYTRDEMRCRKMKAMVDYAISEWEINGSVEDILYVDCS